MQKASLWGNKKGAVDSWRCFWLVLCLCLGFAGLLRPASVFRVDVVMLRSRIDVPRAVQPRWEKGGNILGCRGAKIVIFRFVNFPLKRDFRSLGWWMIQFNMNASWCHLQVMVV